MVWNRNKRSNLYPLQMTIIHHLLAYDTKCQTSSIQFYLYNHLKTLYIARTLQQYRKNPTIKWSRLSNDLVRVGRKNSLFSFPIQHYDFIMTQRDEYTAKDFHIVLTSAKMIYESNVIIGDFHITNADINISFSIALAAWGELGSLSALVRSIIILWSDRIYIYIF